MLNPLSFYSDCGTRAAAARHQRDESRARVAEEHASRARLMEFLQADKEAAAQAFNDAYRAESSSYDHFRG